MAVVRKFILNAKWPISAKSRFLRAAVLHNNFISLATSKKNRGNHSRDDSSRHRHQEVYFNTHPCSGEGLNSAEHSRMLWKPLNQLWSLTSTSFTSVVCCHHLFKLRQFHDLFHWRYRLHDYCFFKRCHFYKLLHCRYRSAVVCTVAASVFIVSDSSLLFSPSVLPYLLPLALSPSSQLPFLLLLHSLFWSCLHTLIFKWKWGQQGSPVIHLGSSVIRLQTIALCLRCLSHIST